MHFSRALRRRLSGWLMVAILFMQVATAAYACPANNAFSAGAAGAATAGMPCAGAMAQGSSLDAEQPGLCQQHCQFGHTQQPSDPWPLLQAPWVDARLLFVLGPVAPPAAARPGWVQRVRTRGPAPPLAHSIEHCCFRI